MADPRYYFGTTEFIWFTRERWFQKVLLGAKVQPPDWWLIHQREEEGRTAKTASIIWYKNYEPARRYVIWDQAPEEDFRARGYLR